MSFRFCPHCGNDLVPRLLKPGDAERLACEQCDFVHFIDPKIAAGCIVEMDGGIVLLRRSIEPGFGKWVFPGGYVDRGERVEDAACRETREEASLDVRVTNLVNVYSYTDRPVIVVVYAAELTGGTLRADDESSEARIFPPSEIPWGELAFPSTFDALREYVQRVHGLEPPPGTRPPQPL